MTTPGFPASVRAIIRRTYTLIHDSDVDDYEKAYFEFYHKVPGAPEPANVTDEDAMAAAMVEGFNSEEDVDWAGLVARLKRRGESELDAQNPYLAKYFAKTDDRPNMWVSDTGTVSDQFKLQFAIALRLASPALNAKLSDILTHPPTADYDMLGEVVDSMGKLITLFVKDVGENDGLAAEFRFGATLCMLMGLGSSAVRVIANQMPDEPDWQHWAHAEDGQITRDALEAHRITGYPIGLLRLEWWRVKHILMQEDFTDAQGIPRHPWWVYALIAVHIIKHCRIRHSPSGPKIFCAYRGVSNLIPVDGENLGMTLGSRNNQSVARVICDTLSLPCSFGAKQDNWLEGAVGRVLALMIPTHIPEAREVYERMDILVGPAVDIRTNKARKNEFRWVDPGLIVRNLATIDLDSGAVNARGYLNDHNTIIYRWPEHTCKPADLENWRSTIPEHVTPMRFSHYVQSVVRNRNVLGQQEGADAVLDAVMSIDFARRELAGSTVGSVIQNEYPLLFILPTGATLEETTNQGKTTLARVYGGAMVPGMQNSVQVANRTTSPPAMRGMSLPIEKYGTAIYDEFQMSTSPEHFLNAAGLQTLATGGATNVGKAMENAPGIRLAHPLVLISKVAAVPPDITNRMAATFLDVLSARSMLTDEEMHEIMSGKAGMTARLCHLLWMRKNNTVVRMCRLGLVSGKWRFNGHLSVACLFAAKSEIESYLAAATLQCSDQLSAADESGLNDDIGVSPTFDPRYYLSQVDPLTLEQLATSASRPEGLSILETLRQIIEDQGKRRFDDVLRAVRIQERAAVVRFTRMLSEKEYVTRDWIISLIPRGDATAKDDRARPKARVKFTPNKNQ